MLKIGLGLDETHEGESLHSDIVEQEDKRRDDGDRIENAEYELLPIQLIQHNRGRHTLRLDARNSEVLLLLG